MTSPEKDPTTHEVIPINERPAYHWMTDAQADIGYLTLNPDASFQETIDEMESNGRFIDKSTEGSVIGVEFFLFEKDSVNLTDIPNSDVLIDFFAGKGIDAKIDPPSNQ